MRYLPRYRIEKGAVSLGGRARPWLQSQAFGNEISARVGDHIFSFRFTPIDFTPKRRRKSEPKPYSRLTWALFFFLVNWRPRPITDFCSARAHRIRHHCCSCASPSPFSIMGRRATTAQVDKYFTDRSLVAASKSGFVIESSCKCCDAPPFFALTSTRKVAHICGIPSQGIAPCSHSLVQYWLSQVQVALGRYLHRQGHFSALDDDGVCLLRQSPVWLHRRWRANNLAGRLLNTSQPVAVVVPVLRHRTIIVRDGHTCPSDWRGLLSMRATIFQMGLYSEQVSDTFGSGSAAQVSVFV